MPGDDEVRINLTQAIIAIVTANSGTVVSSGAPVFVVSSRQEAEEKAVAIARILDGMVHDIGDDTFIIVRH